MSIILDEFPYLWSPFHNYGLFSTTMEVFFTIVDFFFTIVEKFILILYIVLLFQEQIMQDMDARAQLAFLSAHVIPVDGRKGDIAEWGSLILENK